MEFSFMYKSSRTHLGVLALTLVVAVALISAFATIAAASPEYTSLCSDCHGGSGAVPTVTATSGTGVDPVTYQVQQQLVGWAAFDLSAGSARIAGSTASDATFTAPLGHYVRVCASDGSSTGTYSQAWFLKPTVISGHGTASPAGNQLVATGGSQTFTFTPDAGYHVSDVKIGGISNPAAVTAGSYTYSNVQADSEIKVTFASDAANFTITATAGPHGAISPAGATSVAQGASQTYTITPDAGYVLDKLLVDNVAKTAASSYTFSNVTASHKIDVTFKVAAPAKSTLTVAVSGTLKAGKTVTLKGTLKPAHAAKVTLTIQRKSGAKWVKVTSKSATASATTGAYKLAYRLPKKKGSYRVQAAAAGTSAYAKATSAWRSFKVK
jgi:hypothetical protein